jgi:CDP-glycerol glycerophosphotransferase
MKRIIKIFKKIFSLEIFRIINKSKYLKYYKKYKINNKIILLESQHGTVINGNIFYILKELSSNKSYSDYSIFLTYHQSVKLKIEKALKYHDIENVNLVKINTKSYFKILSSAKFLINDTTFLPFFIKKEGQIYLNTWHGTPLKTLGRKIKNDMVGIGNVQNNFIVSDYLLYPNQYTMDHMIEDYMIANLSNAKVLLVGYPRNTEFFNDENKKNIKAKYNLNDKQIIAYMPTWRGTIKSQNSVNQTKNIGQHLAKLELKLTDKQILFVNLHPLELSTVNFSNYTKIKPFPEEYETYEFLNCCDCLITDYSSVLFDYAITKNKIILFPYDEKEYLSVDRGLYLGLEELPFPKVYNVDDLIEEIKTPKNYDDRKFINTFCKYDGVDATKKLCEKFILNKTKSLKEFEIKKNNKSNVLLFVGNLSKNGITTSITNLMNNVDTDKYNYYLTFYGNEVEPNKEALLRFSDNINYLPITGGINCSIVDKVALKLYGRGLFVKKLEKRATNIFKTEINRIYGFTSFDVAIQFNGYGYKPIMIFSQFDCKKVIFMHADIRDEINIKKNQREHLIRFAYKTYDKVAIVSETLYEPTMYYIEDKNKIIVVDNYIDVNSIITNSMKETTFESTTDCNISINKLNNILNDEKKIKFINVGRFSFEKGHVRLIDCFDKIWEENKNCYLVIIGGYGKEYEKILAHAKSKKSYVNIVIIFSISNPFPIIKRCNCFVLSSLYEGFGLALVEADILGLQSFSTDIVGPRIFLKKYNGNLVEDSNEGIYNGMKDYLNNNLKQLKANYEEYNKEAIDNFYKLLK